ncbi:hypothetical protein CK203_080198 [Vitis vinifera]|uniref:Uncharacterized protein n=1 Tax=Vitis vinifera TaxID=29760 RepID=A0A438EP66_VITVI|nr:hypothetical protein CK203_080198 [Vitis vinifera]
MIQITKSYQFLDGIESGVLGHSVGMKAKLSWATLHSLLHSDRIAYRHNGYTWLGDLLIAETSEERNASVWSTIRNLQRQIALAGVHDSSISSKLPLSISLMCGLLKSRHNIIRWGFLFVLERLLMRCKFLLDENEQHSSSSEVGQIHEDSRLEKANVVIDIMSSALSLVAQKETDRINILKNKEAFDNVTSEKEMALNEVLFWDSKEGIGPLTLEDQNARKIKTNGNWVSMESKIKVGMVHIFQSLLAENGDWRPSCLGLTFDALGEYHADLLEVPFFEVEVFKTLFNLKGIKALGPYGFSLVFWSLLIVFHQDFFKLLGFEARGFFPCLFVIVMEALSCMLKRAKDGGFLSGWRKRGQVNLEEGELIPVGSVGNVEGLAQEFKFKVDALPTSHLDLLLADGGCWTPRFYRRLNDWEVNMVEWFLFRLQGWRLCRDEEDKLLWIGVKNGNFFVHALYKALELGSQVTFLASVIWNSWVPPKMCDILFSQLCLKVLPATATPISDNKHHGLIFGSSGENKKVDTSECISQEVNCRWDEFMDGFDSRFGYNSSTSRICETASIGALLLRGQAVVPMQLVARVPAPLFYWPLIQLASAATDDIALGVAVGSKGRGNLPGATSDIRASLLLLLIGKCTADPAAFQEVGGEEFFRELLEDADSRRMMTEEPEKYQRMLQNLIFRAQQVWLWCQNLTTIPVAGLTSEQIKSKMIYAANIRNITTNHRLLSGTVVLLNENWNVLTFRWATGSSAALNRLNFLNC